MTTTRENLGPAETILQAILTYADHMVHNRPGIVLPDARTHVGVRWEPVTHKVEGDQKVVYQIAKVGKKSRRTRLGTLRPDGTVMNGGPAPAGTYRPAGIFPEVATWLYGKVSEVWKLDNEFAARWASHAYGEDHRDLKVVLAAFMLVQSRKGDAVREGDKVAFRDEDYRDVGEAMLLLTRKDSKDMNPKLLLRVYDLLSLPGIAKVNHELGFGTSARHPFYGRWPLAVEKWLRYREENPKMLEGLVKAGFRQAVIRLARLARYKPQSPAFFQALRWKQDQAKDGRRQIAIGQAAPVAVTWNGLTEAQICERIVSERPSWKRVTSLLPKDPGLTRAIAAAAIEAGCLSQKDLVILTPTWEDLGLLQIQDVREKWEKAVAAAEDMRAANIARNVTSQAVKDKLQEAADTALQKAAAEVARDLRVYVMIDISGSMTASIAQAKGYIAKFLQAFPPDRVHVAVFNTTGREITIKHPSAAGVDNAFRGIQAGGGTDYGSGVRVLDKYKPKDGEDALFFFVGDEEASAFAQAVRASGLNPVAFGFLKVGGNPGYDAVRRTAVELGIPCFLIDEKTFDDPYAIPRTIRNLIAATPVGKIPGARVSQRVSLVDKILQAPLLQKPAWA